MKRTPQSIGIIMDGNRRSARARGESLEKGHEAGAEKLKEVISWSREAGISELIVYAFSTENWGRGEREVSYLMTFFERALGEWMQEIMDTGVRVRFIGERFRLPVRILKRMEDVEESTKDSEKGTLAIALSYGGREEIVSAVNNLLQSGTRTVTESEFADALYSKGLKDPELIIRTGGDYRLSNFLPWQSIYSELFFTPTLWPEFTKEEFLRILEEYKGREQRKGK